MEGGYLDLLCTQCSKKIALIYSYYDKKVKKRIRLCFHCPNCSKLHAISFLKDNIGFNMDIRKTRKSPNALVTGIDTFTYYYSGPPDPFSLEEYKVDETGNILAKTPTTDWHCVFQGHGYMKKERAMKFLEKIKRG